MDAEKRFSKFCFQVPDLCIAGKFSVLQMQRDFVVAAFNIVDVMKKYGADIVGRPKRKRTDVVCVCLCLSTNLQYTFSSTIHS